MKPYRKRIEAIIKNNYEKTILLAKQKTMYGSYPSFVGGGINEDEHPWISLQREATEEIGVLINTSSIKEIPGIFRYDYSDLYKYREVPKKQAERMKDYEGTETQMIVCNYLMSDNRFLQKDAMSYEFYSYQDCIDILTNSINTYRDRGIIPVLENRLNALINNKEFLF